MSWTPSRRTNNCGGKTATFPGSLTDLHRFRKTVHGHDGSSRIVMVRKTDQRTFASIEKGQVPKLETITRETVETFRGQRTECKVTTTEKKDCNLSKAEEQVQVDLHNSINNKRAGATRKKAYSKMDFESECLKAHNDYRRRHNVPPLKLDREICRVAQQWANQIIGRPTLQHSNNGDYGENLYCVTSTDGGVAISGGEAVDAWYDEIECHKFGGEPSSLASGHFTQVVWKESARLGVAYAKYGGKVVVVANYYPPGNIIGGFAQNVPPATAKSPAIADKMAKLSLRVTEGDFDSAFLEAHNTYRRRHGVPPLKLDAKLSKHALEWAKHLASKNTLEHRPSSNYGENIYCMYSSDPNFTIAGNNPVDSWYEEVKYHKFGREPHNLKSGHFTQVVWRSSELLGVGVAKNSHGSIYVVANYSPAGNFVGCYVDNVPGPVGTTGHSNGTRDDITSANTANLSDHFPRYAIDGLKVHNEYRRRHGVPELRLDKKLCKYAQEWADTCAKSGSMCHRANSPYGENIFCVYSSDYTHVPTPRDAVKEWYDEIKKHNFAIESNVVNHGTLHFTQVIWRSTTDLGFAMAKNKKGETYVVANYNPRGNCIGSFSQNVPRARP